MDLLLTGGLYLSSLLHSGGVSGYFGFSAHSKPSDVCGGNARGDTDAAASFAQTSSLALPGTAPSSSQLAQWLSLAVQHDTSVYDEWGPLTANSTKSTRENYASTFKPFEAWLAEAFPRVHARLRKEVVNDHGLLFTWQGSDMNAKPLVLMAHQDVVPIEPSTRGEWVHEPFGGYVDEANGVVWGRGSGDDKSGLVGVLSSLERLASEDGAEGWHPSRTIIASFGFDEESHGSGARALAEFLHERYGDDGVEMIVDEGDGVVGAHAAEEDGGVGVSYAGVAVAEVGYADVRVVVNTPGGHSSRPPARTGIGLLSRIVTALEDDPPQVHLDRADHPALSRYICLADSPAIRPRRDLARALRQIHTSKGRRAFLQALRPDELYSFKTTQAVDIIRGGVKINALPERSVATVNYRIEVTQSVDALKERVEKVVQRRAKELGLHFRGWQQEDDSTSGLHAAAAAAVGSVHLELVNPLEPAPHTPLTGPKAAPWRLLRGVIQSVWKTPTATSSGSSDASSSSPIAVIPSLAGGNTDTKSYWALTRNIFRFSGGTLQEVPAPLRRLGGGIHTVNEFVQIDALVKANEFYTRLIVAVQSGQH